MKLRVLIALFATASALVVSSCSSGLGNNLRGGGTTTTTTAASTNLPVGLDIGLTPTSAVGEGVVAGVIIPAIGAQAAREIVLLAFTTAANAADGDGSGTPLSRDTVTDSNGAADVFVAAVCAQDVDTNAFSQSLAGKFRHPRCTTCHSMQAADTNAFVSATAAYGESHAGPPPGPTFPALDEDTCIPCHVQSTSFPVPTWKAPDASFDMRTDTVAELATRAQNIPTGDLEHFTTDLRVLWALDSGILPVVGGRNGIADDDHDGVDEPSDRDGTPRTVPGGSEKFLQEIEDWVAAGRPVTSAAAVKDITLVSRANGTTAAGNGASSGPQVLWVPNGSFDPTNATTAAASNPVGTLYIVYSSDASDLVAGDGNGFTDVFRTAVEVRVEEDVDGSALANGINLQVNGNAVICSATDGTTNEGNGASSRPMIGGATGNLIAFESLATDLIGGFTDGNGASAPDVFVRDIGTNDTHLISHQLGNNATGGDGSSGAPCIDPGGAVVAFESDATDLIASDSNGARDIYYAQIGVGAPFTKVRASVTSTGAQGTGGASSNASVYFSSGRTLCVFESEKTDLAPSLTATSNVYLFDSTAGSTTLLNQIQSTNRNAIGDGSARNAVIGPNGSSIAFESDAGNIDVLRDDFNGVTDVFLVEVTRVLAGSVLPYRFSITTADAADGNGASTMPRFGAFSSASDNYQIGFATYQTAATNLGTPDSTNLMVAFLDETAGVLADFTYTPTSGTVPVTVTFTDASTGGATAWAWDFDNDGNVDSNEQNPTYTYTTPGTFTAKLTASNSVSEASTTKTVTATAPVVTASFTTNPSPATGGVPLTVNFDASASVNAVSYAWDFGDGNNGTGVTTSHTYNSGGAFTVTLTATGQFGNTDTATTPVTAAGAVTATFTLDMDANYTDQMLTLDASGSTGTAPLTYEWDFDNDNFATIEATGVNPTVSIATEFPTSTQTDYTIRLRVTATGGGTAVAADTFTSVAASETVIITGPANTDDAFINSGSAGVNSGTSPDLIIGKTYTAGFRRGLLRFDVSSIPSMSTVSNAVVRFYDQSPNGTASGGSHSGSQLTGTQTYRFRRCFVSWVEGTVTHNSPWSTPGGVAPTDFSSTNTASVTSANSDNEDFVTSGDLSADVQAWVNGTANNGWLIKHDTETGAPTTATIKWFATSNDSTPSQRPRLTVTYQRPLP